jgi:CRISPR/Cas system CSM-associated protein Csm4 (group 5 of RAMP superfamily)
LVDATKAELPDLSDEKAAKSWVGFKSDEGGLYIEGRIVKALLKESANIIKKIVPSRKDKKNPKGVGITNFKSKVADHVFVVEKKIYLTKDGENVKKADELAERPIHVMTAQGPRNSIKRTDLVHGAEVEFTVRRVDDIAVPEKAFYAVLSYGRHVGLGADRSQGMGTFEVVSVEKSGESCLPSEDS